MMLKLIFGLTLCLYFARAQIDNDVTEDEERMPPMECYVGSTQLEFDSTKECQDGHVCQTKVEIQARGRSYLFGECKERNVCENNAVNNQQQCFDARGAKVCHFCCETPMCNDVESVMELVRLRRR